MEAAQGLVLASPQGSEVPPSYQHAPLYEAWAAFERAQGGGEAAAALVQRAAALRPLVADGSVAAAGSSNSSSSGGGAGMPGSGAFGERLRGSILRRRGLCCVDA